VSANSLAAVSATLAGPFRHRDDSLGRVLELTFLPIPIPGELPEPVEVISVSLFDEFGILVFRASHAEGTISPVMSLSLAREFAGRLDHDAGAREWLAREYRDWLARGDRG